MTGDTDEKYMDEYSFEIFADCLTPSRTKRLAHLLKLHPDTVGAWKRPVESTEFPTGTGKSNIVDLMKKVIDDIIKTHPGEAMRIADHIKNHVEKGLKEEGIELADEHHTPCAALAESVKEHADVVIVLAGKPNDPQAWIKARKEIRESVSSMMKLDGCLETLIERETQK